MDDLPQEGIKLLVHTRYDTYIGGAVASCVVGRNIGTQRGPPLELHLYNKTGDGQQGYHYDALVRESLPRAEAAPIASPPRTKRRSFPATSPAPTSQVEPPDRDIAKHLRIASVNVDGCCGSSYMDVAPRRMDLILDAVLALDLDAICFQEVTDEMNAVIHQRLRVKKGWKVYRKKKSPGGLLPRHSSAHTRSERG